MAIFYCISWLSTVHNVWLLPSFMCQGHVKAVSRTFWNVLFGGYFGGYFTVILQRCCPVVSWKVSFMNFFVKTTLRHDLTFFWLPFKTIPTFLFTSFDTKRAKRRKDLLFLSAVFGAISPLKSNKNQVNIKCLNHCFI